MTAITPGGLKVARCYSHPPCTKHSIFYVTIFSAQQVLRAARELVDASEKSMMKDPTDLKWLEVLNEANEKTNQVKNKYVY